jgi:hypothetical protein
MAEGNEASRRELPLVDENQLELFKQFVTVQKDQIDLKGKEIALREKELAVDERNFERSHDYALKALDAQSKDRESDRLLREKIIHWSFILGAFFILLLVAFCSYALSLGKIDMVKEMMLQIFGTGGLGAAMFFAARSLYKTQKRSEDDIE